MRSSNENAPGAAYSTLFFALYDDERGRLTHANCGHPPALLLWPSGALEHLASPAYSGVELPGRGVWLGPVDTLVMFTDGVSEAFDDAGQEFGQEGLAAAVTKHREKSPKARADAVLADVTRSSGREQTDDITLVVARRSS